MNTKTYAQRLRNLADLKAEESQAEARQAQAEIQSLRAQVEGMSVLPGKVVGLQHQLRQLTVTPPPQQHPWLIAPAPKRIFSSIGVCMSILTRKLMRTSRRGGRWKGIRRAVRAVCTCGGVVRPAHNPTCALI